MFGIRFLALTVSTRNLLITVGAPNGRHPFTVDLALARWHGLRELHTLPQSTIIVGAIAAMALLALLVIAIRRQRRRLF